MIPKPQGNERFIPRYKRFSTDDYFLNQELESALYWAGYLHMKRRSFVQTRAMPWEEVDVIEVDREDE